MANPELISGGSTLLDTQRVYTSQSLAVGTVGVLAGRSYVWCSHAGSSALARGEPLVVAAADVSSKNLAITTNGLDLGQTNIVDITAGPAAIMGGAFEEGLMIVVDGGGEGTSYTIEQNTAFSASTADGNIFLRDAIQVASDADTEVSLVENKYVNPKQSHSFGRAAFVGVPGVAVPAGDTTKQYFWAQRNGYCPVFVEGAPRIGESVAVSGDTDGRLAPLAKDAEVVESKTGGAKHVVTFNTAPVVGVMVTDAIDGEVQVVDLQNPIF